MSLFNLFNAILGLNVPRSAEDWQAGDLAICIADNWTEALPENPKKDDLLRVRFVCADNRYLHFESKPDRFHWQAIAFRKVRPDTEPAADEAWVDQLQHMRRKVPA